MNQSSKFHKKFSFSLSLRMVWLERRALETFPEVFLGEGLNAGHHRGVVIFRELIFPRDEVVDVNRFEVENRFFYQT